MTSNETMSKSTRNRILIILGMIAVAVFYLFPRTVTVRERNVDGVMVDAEVTRVPLKRGLDLQGGMHLALELDQSDRVSADPEADIELALTILRKRIDEFGVSEPLVQKQGAERIVVELPGITEPARAIEVVQRSAFLEFKITDKTGALERALPAMDRELARLGITATAGSTTGPSSAVQQLLGTDSTAAEADSLPMTGGTLAGLIQPGSLAGGSAPGEFLVPETAYLRVDSLLRIPEIRRLWPRGYEIKWSNAPTSVGVEAYRFLYLVSDEPIITGEYLTDASAQLDPLTNGPIVVFELNREGGRRFGTGTQRHVGDYMAILLDDRVQGRPPVIQSRIDRRGQITLTGQSLQQAQDLALTLRAGALPVPLQVVDYRQIGPSLGADAIRAGIIATVVGTLVIILIMVGYYRTAGVLAVLALSLYMLFTMGGLAAMGATLTLPGIAGLVLSIGIAVDANVLIFERIREELALGKTVRLAVDEGFRNAMSAIVDSNVTTVITALFLFQFGTGPVQGFAVTLILGTAASMITAIFVTRTFFLLWLERKPAMTTLSI
ncbi:MAG TPA: protein translocase subunit SecD [Gemmatimonadales bacterium]|nr:protein translocase subunit SecD [Gemmatimonadales bacterium]